MVIISDTNYEDLDLIKIDNIKQLNKLNVQPDIINITHINNKYEYKILLRYLKKLKNKILIINDKDKYLKKIFLRNLDIYRYGNNMYDDIEYIKKEDNIIFKYNNDIYKIKTVDENIMGYILIKLLQKNKIKEIISILEKTS